MSGIKNQRHRALRPCEDRHQRRSGQDRGHQRRVDHHPHRHQDPPSLHHGDPHGYVCECRPAGAGKRRDLHGGHRRLRGWATFSSDYLSPSAACMVQRGLGLPYDAVCFDLNAACSGFLFAIHTMECLLAQAPRKYGLVIGAEMLSRFINWEDVAPASSSGTAPAPQWWSGGRTIPPSTLCWAANGDPDMLGVTGSAHPEPAHVFMNGQATFKFAVKAVPYCIDQVLEKAAMSIEDVDFFVFHQANARIIDLAAKKYHIPPEKYYKNIQKYGNTSAASIPLVISELHDLGKVGPGSRVLVVGFGGGLTWGGALVEFA